MNQQVVCKEKPSLNRQHFITSHTMDFHPASNIFPLLEGDKFQALKADIAEHGQLDPIWTFQDQILDGRNRYRACQELGIETATKEWSGTDPLKFVLSMNLRRRHLTKGQQAFVAVEVEKYLAVEAKERQKLSKGRGKKGKEIFPDLNVQARDQAGKTVGVSGKYVSDAKRIGKVSPELAEKVTSGEMNIPQAIAQIKSKQKKPASVRIQEITEGAAADKNSDQIAAELGIGYRRVRVLARKHQILIPGDEVTGRLSRVKPAKVINETCSTLSGCVMGLDLIQNGLGQITPADAQIWADDFSASLKPINKFYRTLRGIANRE